MAEKVSSTVSKVADEVGAKVEQLVEMVDDNILDYCTLDKGVRMCSLASLSTLLAEAFSIQAPAQSDEAVMATVSLLQKRFVSLQGKRPKGRKTLGEKEAEFLDALRVSASSQLHSVKSAVLLQKVALS